MNTLRPRQLSLFQEEVPFHILPTNHTTVNHPFHRWFNFIAGFSPEFVAQCIHEANLQANSLIIDPFAGCGTTMVEASLHRIASVGFEAHPFLANICKSKLITEIDTSIIEEIYRDLFQITSQEGSFSAYSPASLKFLKKLIPESSLGKLISAREKVLTYEGDKSILAHLILSKVLDLVSHSKTDGIYKAPASRKNSISYEQALKNVCNIITKDLHFAHQKKIKNRAQIFLQSSEDMSILAPRSGDLLITSPPYLNNFDYAEMTRMYLYFWLYAKDWGEITDKVRSKLIINTTTALKGHKDKVEFYKFQTPALVHDKLDHYQELLREKRKIKAGKKEYDYLIYPYFCQMTRVLKSAHGVLKHKAPVHIIVADAALYGIHIKTQEILAILMESIGFKDIRLTKLRNRGTRWILDKREGTKEGLGEYQITGYAEHD